MYKKDTKSQMILWAWVGGVVLVLGIIAMASQNGKSAVRQQSQSQVGMQAQAGIPAQGGFQPQASTPLQAGAPVGMNTGALENTYNQIADVMNRFTVSIYGTAPGQGQPQLLGSGVVVSRQLVLTNAHIVNNVQGLFVAVSGAQQGEYPVSIFRCDAGNDLALLQGTNNMDFPAVGMLGNSDKVDRGDIVFATGNAFGTGNVFANGMVVDNNSFSPVSGQRAITKIQTNINIYPGSCGGPLVNIKGEVIGVSNSAGLPENNFMGIGYATPINFAVALLNSSVQNQGGGSPFVPVAFSNNPYVLT